MPVQDQPIPLAEKSIRFSEAECFVIAGTVVDNTYDSTA